jgi:hypothetical protein
MPNREPLAFAGSVFKVPRAFARDSKNSKLKINTHDGRTVKNTGNDLLAEFPECARGGAVCCRIQFGMIPLGLNSLATISIFAHRPLALRAEATT